jgi:hypothetical protein
MDKGQDHVRRARQAALQYFDGLRQKNFDLIPYATDVVLRAPLAPGGVEHPLEGRDQVRAVWWAQLPGLLGAVDVGDVYINDEGDGVVVEAEIEVLLDPPVRLRVADRFRINSNGLITSQTNYFDPRDVTNPGWRDAP